MFFYHHDPLTKIQTKFELRLTILIDLLRQTIDLVNSDNYTQPIIDPAFDIVLPDEDDADIGFSISLNYNINFYF